MVLQAIIYTRGHLQILDQLRLPHTTHYDPIPDTTSAWEAIRSMRTRGAPAIAIVAALGLAVELTSLDTLPSSSDAAQVEAFVKEKLEYLVTSRPTAVNLADAARKLGRVVGGAAEKEGATGGSVREAYLEAAERMLVDDVADNEAIGEYGADWILKHARRSGQVSVLTHCNTG